MNGRVAVQLARFDEYLVGSVAHRLAHLVRNVNFDRFCAFKANADGAFRIQVVIERENVVTLVLWVLEVELAGNVVEKRGDSVLICAQVTIQCHEVGHVRFESLFGFILRSRVRTDMTQYCVVARYDKLMTIGQI